MRRLAGKILFYFIFSKQVQERINARLGLKQSIINIKFILFVFKLLSPFCGLMPVLTNSTRKTG